MSKEFFRGSRNLKEIRGECEAGNSKDAARKYNERTDWKRKILEIIQEIEEGISSYQDNDLKGKIQKLKDKIESYSGKCGPNNNLLHMLRNLWILYGGWRWRYHRLKKQMDIEQDRKNKLEEIISKLKQTRDLMGKNQIPAAKRLDLLIEKEEKNKRDCWNKLKKMAATVRSLKGARLDKEGKPIEKKRLLLVRYLELLINEDKYFQQEIESGDGHFSVLSKTPSDYVEYSWNNYYKEDKGGNGKHTNSK